MHACGWFFVLPFTVTIAGFKRCVYTLMLNTEAGIESDCTVTRLEENKFLLSSGSAMRVKDKWWIEKNTEGMGWDFSVVDATDDYSVIGVFGRSKSP